jgi:hypothetical protein
MGMHTVLFYIVPVRMKVDSVKFPEEYTELASCYTQPIKERNKRHRKRKKG